VVTSSFLVVTGVSAEWKQLTGGKPSEAAARPHDRRKDYDMTAILTEAQKTEELVKLAREQIDAFSKGDWELLREILASNVRYEEFGTGRKVEGPEKIVELFKGWKTAFPDAAGTVTSSFASGDEAAIEVTWKGTHKGPLTTAEGTIPASGKIQETPGAVFYTFEGSKIKSMRQYFDSLTLLKQIGVQPK
jgi:steroid delta-isomerase-like uncharacterized protein